MSILFTSGNIGKMEVKNRFVRSATWEGMATDEGAPTPKLIKTMADLAEGQVGLIITSHAYVNPEGQAGPWQLGIYEDAMVPGLKEMTEAVHEQGAKIAVQIAHAGAFGFRQLSPGPVRVVSDFEGVSKGPVSELTAEDIGSLAADFGKAAARAREAGFDAVQIHSAHGYLLSQFLSPYFNRRKDNYGGPIENRVKAHLQVYKAVRDAVGEDYPVFVKMNCSDFAEGGLEPGDSLKAARMLVDAGLDAVELSGGLLTSKKLSPSRKGINSPDKEAYFAEHAAVFKKTLGVPLILVGGIRSFERAEGVVKEGVADFISMSRPFIREPGLVKRWKQGDRTPARCVSDTLCIKPAMEGKGIYCFTEKKGGRP